MKNLLYSLIIVLVIAACVSENEEDLYPVDQINISSCDTIDVSFVGTIYPIIENKCLSCHNNSFNSGGINLEGYQNVQPIANGGALLSTIKHEGNYSPMPQNADKLDECSISQIEKWINNGTLNN